MFNGAVQNYLLYEPVPSPRPLPGDLVVEPINASIDKKYKVILDLGSGASGSVVLARDRVTKEQVAIKKINKKGMTKTQMTRLRREYGIMKKLDHVNWVKLHEVFEDDIEVCLVMEYASCGDLFSRITESPNSRIAEVDVRPIFAQMAAGLLYLHNMGFVHRDIKPENILLGRDGRVLIADLGFAAMWNEKTLTAAPCGSLYYASPEIIRHDGVYFGPEVDVWSLGATLYAMTCGKLPFQGDSNDEIRDLILEGEFSFPYFLSQPLRNLINAMLNVNPFERITMEGVCNHPWIIGDTKTPRRKVGNSRRHSAFSGFLTLRRSSKEIPLFSSEEEAEVYLEIERLKTEIKKHKKEQKKFAKETKKAEEAQKKKKKKATAKKKKAEDKAAAAAEEKADKGKEKTKRKNSILPVIAEEGGTESQEEEWSVADLEKEANEKEDRDKKWKALQAKQDKKKKRNSLPM